MTRNPQKRRCSRVRTALSLLFAAVFCFAAYQYFSGFIRGKKEQAAFDELSQLVAQQEATETPHPARSSAAPRQGTPEAPQATPQPTESATPTPDPEPVMLPQYALLYERNPDFFAWLSIDGTDVDYPVMYSPDRTEYYLNRDFDGAASGSGVPFIDGKCPPDGNYYLVYGHHMQNKTMFGTLPRYADPDYWAEHPVIRFDTLYERREYAVMAVFYSRLYLDSEPYEFHYYDYYDLTDPQVFEEYVPRVEASALYDTGLTAEYGDELLVLSTCNYHTNEGRFVVVAKRITEGEIGTNDNSVR